MLAAPFRQKTSEWSSDDETKELMGAIGERARTEASGPAYKKSLRLSSEQIVRPDHVKLEKKINKTASKFLSVQRRRV